MPKKTRRQLAEEARLDPNVQLFLDFIAEAEGVRHGYRTIFGNEEADSLDDHPRKRKKFKQTDGKERTTTAAGRYQFLEGTWDEQAKALKLDDFGAEAQDLAAIDIIRRKGALGDIIGGDFDAAVKKLGGTWASLPSSTVPQPKRSEKWVDDWFAKRGQNMPDLQRDEAQSLITPLDPQVAPTRTLAESGTSELGTSVLGGVTAARGNAAGVGAQTLLPGEQAGIPDWLTPLQAQIDAYDARHSEAQALETQSWENQLLQQAIQSDLNEAHNDAVSRFFGEDPVPQIAIPEPIEARINQILARLHA